MLRYQLILDIMGIPLKIKILKNSKPDPFDVTYHAFCVVKLEIALKKQNKTE